MAQSMNRSEELLDELDAGGGHASARQTRAVRRILAAVQRGMIGAEQSAALLESAASAAERLHPAAAMGSEEQPLWERLGARFDDEAVVERASARTFDAFAEIVARSLCSTEAVAERLQVDRSRISQRRKDRSLYSFRAGDSVCYPDWQFLGSETLPGLREVLRALDPELHPLTVDHFFTTPSLELTSGAEQLSPADWLATGGDVGPVVFLAQDL